VSPFHFHFKGHYASVSFWKTDGCLAVNSSVYVADSMYHSTGKPWSSLQINARISRYNMCTGSVEIDAWGNASPSNLVIRKDTATVETDLWLHDFTSNGSMLVSVSLSWIGTGAVWSGHNHSRYRDADGNHTISRSVGRFQDATITATIFDGASVRRRSL
jgi:hypothetical protein